MGLKPQLRTKTVFGCHFATPFFQNKLINVYVKCGSLVDAHKVFDEMTERDGFSWNVMIAAYRRHGFPHKALKLLQQMQRTDVQPDEFTFASILPACAKIGALEQGMEIHQSIIGRGFLLNVVVVSALVDMYAKCRSIHKARELFDSMSERDVASWNAMIAGYAQNGVLDEALRLFQEMPQRNVISWTALIAGYAQNGVIDEALRLFKEMPHRNVVSWNAMIAGYAQNGILDEALAYFEEIPQRNVASWNAMIAGYAQNGFIEKAVETFKQMQVAGIMPNFTTFASILPACTKMRALQHGMDIHQTIMDSGCSSDVEVQSMLVDMYAKCGNIQKARELFDKMSQRDEVSWNAMIAGYAQNGVLDEALRLFKEMPQRDVVSWNTMIAVYAQNGVIDEAIRFFKEMPQRNVVSWNAMIAGYVQNGVLDEASRLFKEMPQRDVVSWNVMIAGYAQNGLAEKALETFKHMQLEGVKPDSATFAGLLPACAKMGALEQGKDVHQRIIESGFLSDVIVASALVDMYAKCGSIQKAREMFDKASQRDAVLWNVMIAGYAVHGFHKEALKLFELMKLSGTYPDQVSLLCILFACSHAGLVNEGCNYFNGMSESDCIRPTIDHYACMVDLLGRAGCLEEALIFIIKMPIKPAVVVWMCLLGACRSHNNIALGVFTATLLFDLDHRNAAPYVLLSNIYADVGRWDDVQKARRLMKDRGIKKIPGCSWIEVNKMVHAFCMGDRSHPQTQEIHATLEKLSQEIKAAGYSPGSIHVLNDVEEEEKELFLCHHSEKLAIAFGLLNTSPGTVIRVVKNLRVCVACHTATKNISKIVAREIIVRDANRFHHFKQGQCSCGDYW
ncbi:pentatricopeptide repeat-containing protein At1g09410, mitochondrial [Cryptomeria japonica]|uniref:pentatricopeptide repeat-containing protein At1g09410, mitochondrial n=1 Tax=Cryptomeria japonica TaxID=3369 RepID=UPI0027DA3A62|nr:pentatricopeptide repeat-containing protein At1g09410, mitochondrial [Cryptomeria japonica]